jgi:ATP-binding cassette subfamily G (WHITE) protein 2
MYKTLLIFFIVFNERPIFVRERATGLYRTSSYFIAKTVCDLIPMRVLPSIILGGIPYYMIGFQPALSHFGYLILTLVLTNLVAATMCLVISASIPSVSVGNLVAIIGFLFSMLFGGLFLFQFLSILIFT